MVVWIVVRDKKIIAEDTHNIVHVLCSKADADEAAKRYEGMNSNGWKYSVVERQVL